MSNVVTFELFRLERSRNLHWFLEKMFHAASNRTSFVYDASTGRKTQEINALDKSKTFTYNARGQVISIRGDIDYSIDYVYDSYGRMTQLKTYRDANLENPDVTTWNYQASTGLLTSKTYADNKSVAYTYTTAGQLATRTWSRQTPDPNPQPLLTTYSYNLAGDLTSIDYSDTTPDVAFFTYNRLGQQLTVNDAVGSRTFSYNSALQLTSEEITGLYSKTISRSYDSLGRSSGMNIGTEYDVDYAYDTLGRFSSVTSGSDTFTYSYLANSNLISGISYPHDISVTNSYESSRDLVTSVENKYNSTIVSNYDYSNDELGRRAGMGKSGTAFSQTDTITYGYNDKSEVTSAISANFATYNYGFSFDPIGNRVTSSSTETGSTVTRNYTSNHLNQYTEIDNPTEAPTYDFDGNMASCPLSSGVWIMTWDAENRLISAEKSDAKLEFKYDYMSRRVEKKVYSGSTGNWILGTHLKFVYACPSGAMDGYLQIEELDALNSNEVTNKRVWSPALQGLGSERLLSETVSGIAYYATTDANKNVTEYLDASGTIKAHYELSPFGKVVTATGTMSGDFNYRFSSEYLDVETGLVYYNFRFYSPELGRWLSRDPITEYGFCAISYINKYLQIKYFKKISLIINFYFFQKVLKSKSQNVTSLDDKHSVDFIPLTSTYLFATNSSINFVDYLGLDNPGADCIPEGLETPCVLECAAKHDKCYDDNKCTWISWFSPFSPSCVKCNLDVAACMAGCLIPLEPSDDPNKPNYYCAKCHKYDDPDCIKNKHTTDPPPVLNPRPWNEPRPNKDIPWGPHPW